MMQTTPVGFVWTSARKPIGNVGVPMGYVINNAWPYGKCVIVGSRAARHASCVSNHCRIGKRTSPQNTRPSKMKRLKLLIISLYISKHRS